MLEEQGIGLTWFLLLIQGIAPRDGNCPLCPFLQPEPLDVFGLKLSFPVGKGTGYQSFMALQELVACPMERKGFISPLARV